MGWKRHGILGFNERNLIIAEHTSRENKRFADSKMKTKEFFGPKGVAVPELFAFLKTQDDVDAFDMSTITPPFVIKPNKGFAGKGIYVITSQDQLGNYVTKDDKILTPEEIQKHLQFIISGYFSISGNRDQVLIEQMIVLDSQIELLGKYGLPDIRVISYNQIPLIAMLRIPSEKSGGKANMHMGAYAAGIDMGDGTLTTMYSKAGPVDTIPGMGDIRGVKIPHWNDVLKLTTQAQKFSKIPYLACDITIDHKMGPLLLELNVRPGLEVQNVNRIGLGQRLKKVADIHVDSIEKGVRLAQDMFGRHIDDHVKKISTRKIIGPREYAYIEEINLKSRYIAHVDIHRSGNLIATSVAEKIQEQFPESRIFEKEDKKFIKLGLYMLGDELHSVFEITHKEDRKIILGKNLLKKFLIDSHKYDHQDLPDDPYQIVGEKKKNVGIIQNQHKQSIEVDKKLMSIDKKLNILKYIQPQDLEADKIQFIQKSGNHKFTLKYAPCNLDLDMLLSEMDAVSIPDIPLKFLYEEKREEMRIKIDLLRALKSGQNKKFSQLSQKLYGGLDEHLVEVSYEKIKNLPPLSEQTDFLSHEEIKEFVKKFLHIYDINMRVFFSPEGVSRVAVKKDSIRFREDIQINKKELRSIIAHEIETHYLRRINGRSWDLQILNTGTAGYIQTEEGMAIAHQNRFLTADMSKSTSIYRLYAALDFAQNYSYSELIDFLSTLFNGDYAKVFNQLIRMKRGLTDVTESYVNFKDSVYLNGFSRVEKYIESGASVRDLYAGKYDIKDLPLLREAGFTFQADMKVPIFVV